MSSNNEIQDSLHRCHQVQKNFIHCYSNCSARVLVIVSVKGRHFVTSTKWQESHYIGVVNNPPQYSQSNEYEFLSLSKLFITLLHRFNTLDKINNYCPYFFNFSTVYHKHNIIDCHTCFSYVCGQNL